MVKFGSLNIRLYVYIYGLDCIYYLMSREGSYFDVNQKKRAVAILKNQER